MKNGYTNKAEITSENFSFRINMYNFFTIIFYKSVRTFSLTIKSELFYLDITVLINFPLKKMC